MTLMERIQAAGNAGERTASDEYEQAFQELRRMVQTRVPAKVLGTIRAENPARAESEVRVACETIFQEFPWLIEGDLERSRAISELLDTIFGLGPLEGLLGDESVTEIMLNGVQSLFIERAGLLEELPNPFTSQEDVRTLIDRIIGPLGRRIDESSPMVNARLAQGHRVHAIIAPLAPDGPIVTIRKFRVSTITLEEMRDCGSIEQAVFDLILQAVQERKNIAVSGGTGSGKTTLLNALSCKIAPNERIITIEDSLELRFSEHPHVIRLEARPAGIEGTGEVTIRDLVVNALRMRPDRIIVGECRGGEALDMLQAMNTGHDGSLTTLHANSAQESILRLAMMVRYAADLPISVIEAQIGCALDLVIQTARTKEGQRFVSEIARVQFNEDAKRCETVQLYQRIRADRKGTWMIDAERR